MTDNQPIPLSRPDITDVEREAVLAVLRTDNLSLGPKLGEFEKVMADYVGTGHAVAVNSGTSALHLAMLACGIGPGDEVITTPFSFIASANCALFVDAKPVFVDIDEATLNITADSIESAVTERTKAILPVHVFGRPCEMRSIQGVAEKHNLDVIEDSCEALGARIEGKHAGTWGRCGTFAFYPNKQITTGEGGILVTDDEEVAQLARSLRNQGRSTMSRWLQHERLGYNYRLSDIACALGIAQLSRIEEILDRRTGVAECYLEHLADIPDVIPPSPPRNGLEISWFVFVVRLSDRLAGKRDEVMKRMLEDGIATGAYFSPLHLQPVYADRFGYTEGDFPATEKVSSSTMALPFFTRMTEEQIARVCETLRSVLGSI